MKAKGQTLGFKHPPLSAFIPSEEKALAPVFDRIRADNCGLNSERANIAKGQTLGFKHPLLLQ
jgi:hypothetical protein